MQAGRPMELQASASTRGEWALPANGQAVIDARAKLRANAPGVPVDHVNRFVAFVRHLDGLESPISIEAFGPDGTKPIQEQEQFLNDVIAADPAVRAGWRSGVGAVLEIHYEHEPAVVGLRLAANHAAVRAARAKLRADAPGVSNQVVTEFIAFVKHLDGLPVPISIKAFGPDGTEPIQDQEQFLNNEIAADRGHRRNWRAAVRAVLWT